jgi:flagellar biosynthetic protein FliR
MIISAAQAQYFFLGFTRIMAVLVVVPILAGQMVPAQVRLGLGLLLSLMIIPWQAMPENFEAVSFLGFTFMIIRELAIGLLLSFAVTLTFSVFQIAGQIMGLTSGFSANRVLNPAIGETGSAIDQFFSMVAMLLFLVIDGHHMIIHALGLTFEVSPLLGAFPQFTIESMDYLGKMFLQMISAGIEIALPVVGTLLLTDLTLGLLARVAPQIQVFFLGLPLKIGVGLLTLSIAMSVILPRLADIFRGIPERMLGLIGG